MIVTTLRSLTVAVSSSMPGEYTRLRTSAPGITIWSASLSAIVVSTLPLLTPTSTPLDCRNGYCVTRRVSDVEALASDCNPARKDPPSPKAPTPPKDAPPPGGYNPKV